MKNISIGISFDDSEYEIALAEGLSKKRKNMLVTIINRDQLHNAKYILSEFDIVLSDDDKSDESTKPICIFPKKVMGLNALIKIIMSRYTFLYGNRIIEIDEEKCKFISVISGCGGSGTTSISLGICQELKRFYDKETCYISLEAINETEIHFMVSDEEFDGARLLYRLENKDFERLNIEDYIVRDKYNVAAFYSNYGLNILYSLSIDEFIRIIAFIGNYGGFEYIVFDIGNHYNEKTALILEKSNHILLVKKEEEDRKSDKLLDFMGIVGDERAKEKTKIVCIEKDLESFLSSETRNTITLDGAFGMDIKDIVQDLT